MFTDKLSKMVATTDEIKAEIVASCWEIKL